MHSADDDRNIARATDDSSLPQLMSNLGMHDQETSG